METPRSRTHPLDRILLLVRTFALFLLLFWGVGATRQLLAEELTLLPEVEAFLTHGTLSHWNLQEGSQGFTAQHLAWGLPGPFVLVDLTEPLAHSGSSVAGIVECASTSSSGFRFPLARSQLDTFPEAASRGGGSSQVPRTGGGGGGSSTGTEQSRSASGNGQKRSAKENRLSELLTPPFLSSSERPQDPKELKEITARHMAWLDGTLHGKEPPSRDSSET